MNPNNLVKYLSQKNNSIVEVKVFKRNLLRLLMKMDQYNLNLMTTHAMQKLTPNLKIKKLVKIHVLLPPNNQ